MSGLANAWDARHPDALPVADLHAFVEALTADGSAESTAALMLLARLLPDELAARRVARAVAGREAPPAEWLRRLDEVHATRTLRMSELYGLGEQYWLEVAWPSGEQLSLGLLIDLSEGLEVDDAIVIPEGLDVVIQASRADVSSGALRLEAIDPADLRARTTQAIRVSAERDASPTSESWPAARPLVEWLLGKLPGGGQGFPELAPGAASTTWFASSAVDTSDTYPYPASDDHESFAEYAMGILADQVGGQDALDALDSRPLPDEPFDWSVVPADARPMVGTVLELLDAFADGHAGVEIRTACRRFLADVTDADPRIFVRRSSPHTAAAAIAFGITRANSLIGPRRLTGLDLAESFGLSAVPSSRLDTMVRAVGAAGDRFQGSLGDARLLTSDRRAELIEARDRFRTAIEAGERWP